MSRPKEAAGGRLQDQRGMALLITILLLSLLVVVTMEYHRTSWNMLLQSNSFLVGHRLQAMAESGINIGEGLLNNDLLAGDTDSLLDAWANIEADTVSSLFSGGRLQLQIVDLSGRLPVNKLVRSAAPGEGQGGEDNSEQLQILLLQLLETGKFAVEDEAAARVIVDSLIDWLDTDEDESEFGAEDGFYLALDPGYRCRNGPLQSIDELLLVRGITPELLYGAKDKEALADYLTVYGKDGKINLNTAPLLVIQSMDPLLEEQMVAGFDEFRRDKENETNLSQADWYTKVNGWPGDIVLDAQLLTTTSSYFRIVAKAGFETRSVTVTADIERDENGTINLLRKVTE